jgi:hypothetical protein
LAEFTSRGALEGIGVYQKLLALNTESVIKAVELVVVAVDVEVVVVVAVPEPQEIGVSLTVVLPLLSVHLYMVVADTGVILTRINGSK